MMITDRQARRIEIEAYIASAKRHIAVTDAIYGGHTTLVHQDGGANVDIMLAQYHERRIGELRAELRLLPKSDG